MCGRFTNHPLNNGLQFISRLVPSYPIRVADMSTLHGKWSLIMRLPGRNTRLVKHTYREETPVQIQLFQRKVVEKNCVRDNPERQYGMWLMHCSWHCSCRTYFCRTRKHTFKASRAILSDFFGEKSELKTTRNTFRDIRVHFTDDLSRNSFI